MPKLSGNGCEDARMDVSLDSRRKGALLHLPGGPSVGRPFRAITEFPSSEPRRSLFSTVTLHKMLKICLMSALHYATNARLRQALV